MFEYEAIVGNYNESWCCGKFFGMCDLDYAILCTKKSNSFNYQVNYEPSNPHPMNF